MTLREHFSLMKRAIKKCFELEKKYMVCLMLSAFLDAVTGYIPIYFSAKVIDALVQGAPFRETVMYVLLTVGLVFLVKLVAAFVSSVRDVYANALYRSEDWSYSEKAMQMAYESIENPEVTRLRYRVRMDSQTGFNGFYLLDSTEKLIIDGTKIVASAALTASFFALPAISVSIKLSLIASLVILFLVSMRVTAKAAKLDNEFMALSADANRMSAQYGKYTDDYSSGKDIRLYGMKDYLADMMLKYNAEYFGFSVKSSYKKAIYAIPGTLLENVFQYAVYAVLIFAALMGEITVGSIAKYVTCIMMLIGAFTDMMRVLQRAFDNNRYIKRYFEYFDIPNNMYQGTLTVEKRDDNEYYVEFRNVSFKYPNSSSYALKNIDLKFKVGEKLAIVGMNGSGKTTFIKLLCRLYDPTEGEILLNGVNIQKYDYDEYMSIFSVVFQDFKLFGFKLGEVVASNKEFDPHKVEECLAKANFGARFSEFPNGADTYLYKSYDKSGVEISGGEAQKIALARALYKDAPFILLDEPTAALDPVSEYEVYSDFNAISGDKTTVYISHRLASCRFCDKIAVFDDGKIVQTGDHESLVADVSGKYHELWEAQAQYYIEQ